MLQDKVHLSFYQFVRLGQTESLTELRKRLKAFCVELGLRGTILLAPEGVNAMVTGTEAAITALRDFGMREFGLRDVDFKEARVPDDSFNRMLVKIKKEIITVGDPDLRPAEYTAPRILPSELKRWLDEKREVILLDTRNRYEIEVGTFAGAQPIDIDTSRDFAKQAQAKLEDYKDQTVVTFCTGGIRCEKGAALLLKLGLKNVLQLDGGILRYFEENGAAHFEGNCFVFDQRMAVDGALRPVQRAEDPNRSFGRHLVK